MEQIVKELHEAAAKGSTSSLVNLVEKDPFILDRCMVISYEETPLHLAAMLGHLDFCIELLKRKPELAQELNSRRSSPLHLASSKGFTQIVKLLIEVCPKMGFSFDEDGKLPIHIAAIKGRIEVLKELINAQPLVAHTRVEMCQGETILHLCVQYSQLEALRFLVDHLNDEALLNAKDNNGNSILHLAVFDKQVQIIKYLVENTKIDVFAVNSNGLTASGILAQMRRDSKYVDIFDCLHNYESQSSKAIAKIPSRRYEEFSKSEKNKNSKLNNKSGTTKLDKQTNWLEEQQNSIMIVASLIATVGFQAGLTPPGGFWQEDDEQGHKAGESIFADTNSEAYNQFMISNTVGFIFSLSVILFLVSGLPFTRKIYMWILRVILWISISAMAFTYTLSFRATLSSSLSNNATSSSSLSNATLSVYNATLSVSNQTLSLSNATLSVYNATLSVSNATSSSDSKNHTYQLFGKILEKVIIGWLMVMGFLNLMHTIRLISYIMRNCSSCIKKFVWTSMAVVLGVLIAFALSFLWSKVAQEDNDVAFSVFIVVLMGCLALWTVLGGTILISGVVIATKKLGSYFTKIKDAMRGLRKKDGIIVV